MILGLIEHDKGVVSGATLEMLTFARGLAATLDVPLKAVAAGATAGDAVAQIAGYGIQEVIVATHDQLNDFAAAAWAQCVVATMADAAVVVAAGTDRGSEVMAHVAARTGLPMSANCLEVTPGDGSYRVKRVRWGGSLIEEADLHGATKLMTVAMHTFSAEPDGSAAPAVTTMAVDLSPADLVAQIVRHEIPEGDGVSLTDARIVVGGGRGVGSSEGFESLEELAALVDGAIGCSRAVTNSGWRPHSDQIGQTGARVAPDLYIACGISGAIQHMAGCKGSKNILVVNKDPEAPILQKAQFAVIGDLHEIVPALCDALKKQ